MGFPATAEVAVIDNDNLTLKGLKAKFTGPDHYIQYPFLIKNEGQYDAYFNLATYQNPTHTCEAGEGTTESLVAKVCQNMEFQLSVGYLDEATSTINWNITNVADASGNVKIDKGGFLVGVVKLYYIYSTDRADGPMSVNWDDLKLTVTSNAQ